MTNGAQRRCGKRARRAAAHHIARWRHSLPRIARRARRGAWQLSAAAKLSSGLRICGGSKTAALAAYIFTENAGGEIMALRCQHAKAGGHAANGGVMAAAVAGGSGGLAVAIRLASVALTRIRGWRRCTYVSRKLKA